MQSDGFRKENENPGCVFFHDKNHRIRSKKDCGDDKWDAGLPAAGESIREELRQATGSNAKWKQYPFNGDYTSSIFVSQDPVAIDSVGADFLMNEPSVTNNNDSLKNNPTVENYLHEAGLVGRAPSKTAYQDGNGKKVKNLGVHEHWQDPVSKRYSRKIGKKEESSWFR